MDRYIVQAAREGDPHAKDALGSWLDAELRAFFADSKGRERVDDLIQDALVDIVDKLALAPDDPELFRSFVHSFAGMEVRESSRKRGRELARAAALRQEPHTPAESPSASVLGPILNEQQRQLVIEYAQRLRPKYCRALLHVLDGGDYKSLAASEGINESTAASRISYATAGLSRSIEADRRTPPPYRTRPPKCE
jgi:DNA-directed RNA polymerase specialized sigma24 family protein